MQWMGAMLNQAKNVYMRPYMVLWHVLVSEVRKALHILGNLDKNYKWFNVFSQSFFSCADYYCCWPCLTAPLNGSECMDTSPPSPTTEVNSCLHSWHKLIKYNNPDKKEQIWGSFVSGDLFWPFSPSPCADGQKRKKSLRRKLDSLAKEKSKDKGTPSSFNTHSDILPFHRLFSLCVSLPSVVFVMTVSIPPPSLHPTSET